MSHIPSPLSLLPTHSTSCRALRDPHVSVHWATRTRSSPILTKNGVFCPKVPALEHIPRPFILSSRRSLSPLTTLALSSFQSGVLDSLRPREQPQVTGSPDSKITRVGHNGPSIYAGSPKNCKPRKEQAPVICLYCGAVGQ